MALYNITTKSEFEEKVLNSKNVVLVDFWAAWCAPCLAMTPLLSTISEEFDGTVDVVKVNIEESQENQMLAGEYGVQSIPNMPIFKGGREAERIIGTIPRVDLTETLTKIVG